MALTGNADADFEVRKTALAATAHCVDRELWGEVVNNLSRSDWRVAAEECLARGGEASLPLWRAAVFDAKRALPCRLAMVHALDTIPGPQALDVLVQLLQTPDTTLRHDVLAALAKRRSQLHGSLHERCRRFLDGEVRRGAWVLQSLLEVADRNEQTPLTLALESEFTRIQQRIVWLLTLVHSMPTCR